MQAYGGLRCGLLASLGLLAAGEALAQASSPPAPHPAEPADVEEVVVTREYGTQNLDSPRFTQPLLDTPQSITVLPDALLEEQGRRTLRDALRNVTGVSILAGEGTPQQGGGDILTIRGFTARDDILVDGVTDVGVYFRDPFNTSQVEVFKGPSSAFAGRGNTGGTINIVSRLPTLADLGEAELSVGTHGLYRATFDVNHLLSEEGGVAVRVNGLYHQADEAGRDRTHNERWAIAPSISFGLEGATPVTVDWFHLQQNNQPDLGIPNARQVSFMGSGLEGRVLPVDSSNYYGYASDYQEVTVDRLTARAQHYWTDDANIRSILRYGRAHSDQIVSAPVVECACPTNSSDSSTGNPTTLTPATRIQGFAKPRDQVEEILASQTDLSLDFSTGVFRHNFIAGLEFTAERLENRRRIDRLGPALNAFDPAYVAAPDVPYQGTRARLSTDTSAAYLFDNVSLGRWELNLGVRYDDVSTRVRGFDDVGLYPEYVADVRVSDQEVSHNVGLVFKPTPESTLYLAYATAFEPSGRVDVVRTAGRTNAPPATLAELDVEPERSASVEFGGRWRLMKNRLGLAGAVFQIERDRVRTPGVNAGDPLVVSEGEQRIRGFEMSAEGAVTERWDVFAGYTYLDGEITRTNFAPDLGRRLPFTAQHSLSAWTSYEITDAWKIGGGVQHLSDRVSEITAARFVAVTSPGYTIGDAFAEFRVSAQAVLRLNVYNVTDEVYFQAFQNNHSIPAARRSAVVSLTVQY